MAGGGEKYWENLPYFRSYLHADFRILYIYRNHIRNFRICTQSVLATDRYNTSPTIYCLTDQEQAPFSTFQKTMVKTFSEKKYLFCSDLRLQLNEC